jgi:hypothetical protein
MAPAQIDLGYGRPNGWFVVQAKILENLLVFTSVDRCLRFDNDDGAH